MWIETLINRNRLVEDIAQQGWTVEPKGTQKQPDYVAIQRPRKETLEIHIESRRGFEYEGSCRDIKIIGLGRE